MAPDRSHAGLTDDELLHFKEHGWVLVENVLSADECARLRTVSDAIVANGPSQHVFADPAGPDDGMAHGRVTVTRLLDHEEHAREFEAFLLHPRVLPCVKQLIGAPPQYTGGKVHITPPHPDRHDERRRRELREPDGGGFSWHRGIRPKWASVPSVGGRYVHSTWLQTATFLSDATHIDDGATALLSGTNTPTLGDFAEDDEHTFIVGQGRVQAGEPEPEPEPVESEALARARAAGAPAWTLPLRDQLPDWRDCLSRQAQIVCPQGAVCFFCESTVHSGMAVLSERIRYAMFHEYTAPWWKPPGPPAVSPEAVERATSDELREILGFAHRPSGTFWHLADARL